MWVERKWVKCRPWILQNGYSLTKHDLCSDFHPPTVELWQINPFYPAVLEWSVGNTTCEEALKDERTYKCKENTVCENRESNFGYRCKCLEGFRGNAYIQNDCDQDVDECENLKLNNCLPGHCISEGVAGAALTLILAYFLFKHRIMLKGRKDFFKQNGGIMLEKMLSTCQDPVNKLKIFTEEELNRATDNLNDTNIIGQGGNGTVYKDQCVRVLVSGSFFRSRETWVVMGTMEEGRGSNRDVETSWENNSTSLFEPSLPPFPPPSSP
ncbi:wall-associated receptor kinase 2 [Tanacetum coccineum]